MNLTESPDIVTWPDAIHCFVEGIGPFQETTRATWPHLLKEIPALPQAKLTHHFFASYKIEALIYRAGVEASAMLDPLPAGLRCETFKGGRYARFVLTGSYSNLGAATARVVELVKELRLDRRDDFWIENYMNDPKTTPENELVTEILVPIR